MPENTVPTRIDETAPVIARHQLQIAAPLEHVWSIHTDVQNYPTWQTDIDTLEASAEGLTPGMTFDWTTSGLDIHTTVYRVDDTAHETLWGGPAQEIVAVHHWVFTPQAGGTRVSTEESWDGAAIRQDVAGMQQALDASLIAWLEKLKAHAEGTLPSGKG